MNNNEIVSSGKMTETLIGNYLLFGIPFGILSSIIQYFIANFVTSIVLMIILSVALQAIILIILWRICVWNAFKKITITYEDVSKVMKNLVVFTIIASALLVAYNFYETKNNFEESLESNFEIKYYENFINKFYSDEEKAKYELEKENAIKEAETTLYTSFVALEVSLTAVNFAVLKFVKKEMIECIELKEVNI